MPGKKNEDGENTNYLPAVWIPVSTYHLNVLYIKNSNMKNSGRLYFLYLYFFFFFWLKLLLEILGVSHASQRILQQPRCPDLWTSHRQSGYNRWLLIPACLVENHSRNTCTLSQRGLSHQGKGDSHQTLWQLSCCNKLSLLQRVTIHKPKSGNCNSLWEKDIRLILGIAN